MTIWYAVVGDDERYMVLPSEIGMYADDGVTYRPCYRVERLPDA